MRDMIKGRAANTQRTRQVGTDNNWTDPAELTDHLLFNRSYPQAEGDMRFSATDIRADLLGGESRLVADHYSHPSLLPLSSQLGGAALATPTGTTAVRGSGGVTVTWQAGTGAAATSYAVYRIDGGGPADACTTADGSHLIGTVRPDAALTMFSVVGERVPLSLGRSPAARTACTSTR